MGGRDLRGWGICGQPAVDEELMKEGSGVKYGEKTVKYSKN